MAKFRPRSTVEAVQLTWGTWNEVADLIGEFSPDQKGVYVDDFGNAHEDHPGGEPRIGFRYTNPAGIEKLAVENDWIIRGTTGIIFHWPADAFAATYEPVSEHYNDHPPLE